LSAYATAFPDYRLTTDDLLAEADRVTYRWTFTGTHKGPLAQIAPTGRKVSVQSIGIARVAAGKASELNMVWDKYALMQQIGALASPAAR